jgi:hypothetical protein
MKAWSSRDNVRSEIEKQDIRIWLSTMRTMRSSDVSNSLFFAILQVFLIYIEITKNPAHIKITSEQVFNIYRTLPTPLRCRQLG